jgi:RNA polymerase sigma factor (sigma-70 family)
VHTLDDVEPNQGRPPPFETSVAPYLLDMSRLAARLVGEGDADDVAQEALTRAWQRRTTFDPARGSLRSWLLAITADQARRWRTRRPRPVRSMPRECDTDRDRALDLRDAVALLPPRQRLAVELHYYVGLPVGETAEVMGISDGTVKSTLADARARLRTVLEDG